MRFGLIKSRSLWQQLLEPLLEETRVRVTYPRHLSSGDAALWRVFKKPGQVDLNDPITQFGVHLLILGVLNMSAGRLLSFCDFLVTVQT